MFLFSGHLRPRPNPKLAGIKPLRLRARGCARCQFARDPDLSRRQCLRLKFSFPLFAVPRSVVPGQFGLSIQFGPPKFSRRSETLPKGDPLPHGRAERLRESLGQRSEEHTSELQSLRHLVCRLLLEKKNCYPPYCSTPPQRPGIDTFRIDFEEFQSN